MYGLIGVYSLAPGVLVPLGVLWIGGGRLNSPVLLQDFLFLVLVACVLLFMSDGTSHNISRREAFNVHVLLVYWILALCVIVSHYTVGDGAFGW